MKKSSNSRYSTLISLDGGGSANQPLNQPLLKSEFEYLELLEKTSHQSKKENDDNTMDRNESQLSNTSQVKPYKVATQDMIEKWYIYNFCTTGITFFF